MMVESTYLKDFKEIKDKTFQALRIINALEKKKADGIDRLVRLSKENTAPNHDEILKILNSLLETYNREMRVFEICRRGLDNTRRIFNDFQADMDRIRNETLSTKIKNKIPFLRQNKDEYEEIDLLLKLMYRELNKEIIYSEELFIKILGNVQEQHTYLLGVISEMQRSGVPPDFSRIGPFQALVTAHRDQIRITDRFGKKSSIGKVIGVLQTVVIKVAKYPKLAAAQSMLAGFFPTMYVSFAASIFLGPQLFPLLYLIGKCLEFSPTIAILLLELRRSRKE